MSNEPVELRVTFRYYGDWNIYKVEDEFGNRLAVEFCVGRNYDEVMERLSDTRDNDIAMTLKTLFDQTAAMHSVQGRLKREVDQAMDSAADKVSSLVQSAYKKIWGDH